MISPNNLIPGDIVVYDNPNPNESEDEFEVGLFVRIVKWRTQDKGIDLIVLNTLGYKTTIRESNIRWDMTASYNENGVAS